MTNPMNKIEQLIEELCPNGVEVRALGEVCDFKNGFAFKSSLFKESGLPIIRITNVDGKNVDLTDVKYFDPVDYSKGNPLNYPIVKGDVLIAMSGATTGKIGFFKSDETAYLNQRVGKFEPQIEILNNRYLYHFLLTKADFLYVLAGGGGAQPNLSSNKLKEKFQIPIPPLAIQEEIVKILDNFTRLEAELEAELEARKKQYEHYREELLSFGDDVEFRALGEIGEIIRGNGLQKKDFTETGVGCIHYGQIYTYYGTFADKTKTFVSPELSKKLKKAQKGDVLIAGVSENIEDVCKPLGWLGDEICISGDMFAFRHNQNTKFITYLLQTTNFQKYKERYAQGAKVTRVKTSRILDYKIPIPPLSKQKEIVAILDKFDALVNDISTGLPAEIAARKKQYEYYRNQLLSFPARANGRSPVPTDKP